MEGTTINPSSRASFWKMLRSEVLQRSFNRTAVWNLPKRNFLIRKLFGSIDGDAYLIQIPFHTSLGCNIHAGKNLFVNNNCVMMDYARITIGDNVLIAPNVTITTVNHSLDPEQRRVCYKAQGTGLKQSRLDGVSLVLAVSNEDVGSIYWAELTYQGVNMRIVSYGVDEASFITIVQEIIQSQK